MEKNTMVHEKGHCDFAWLHGLCIILYTITLTKSGLSKSLYLLYIREEQLKRK